jgi:hypothetical protein
MTERFRVPKHVFPAEVTLVGHEPLSLRFFLSELAETHSGPERPSDLLKYSRPFIPTYDPATESVIILRREAIMVLSVSASEEYGEDAVEDEVGRSEEAVALDVKLVLMGQVTISGKLTYLMPEGRRRIQDFLNAEEPFVSIRDGDTIRFINKGHIIKVTPLDSR